MFSGHQIYFIVFYLLFFAVLLSTKQFDTDILNVLLSPRKEWEVATCVVENAQICIHTPEKTKHFADCILVLPSLPNVGNYKIQSAKGPAEGKGHVTGLRSGGANIAKTNRVSGFDGLITKIWAGVISQTTF